MSEHADYRFDLLQSHRRAQSTLDTCTAFIGQRPGSENCSADTSAHSRRHPHQPQYGTVGDVPVSSSSSNSTASGLSSALHPPSSKQQPSDQRAELARSKHSCGLRSQTFSHALLAALLCSLLLSTPLQAARTGPPPPVDSQVCLTLAVQLTGDRRHAPALLLCLLHAMRCRQGTGCLIIQYPWHAKGWAWCCVCSCQVAVAKRITGKSDKSEGSKLAQHQSHPASPLDCPQGALTCLCVRCSRLPAQAPPQRQGYEYAGRVKFIQQQNGGVPVLDLDTVPPVKEKASIEHHTVLVTRSGHSFVKRWVCHIVINPAPCCYQSLQEDHSPSLLSMRC